MTDFKELINRARLYKKLEHSPIVLSIYSAMIDAIEQLVKERDAAVKYIPRQCDTCRHYKHDERETSCMKFGCENWKIKENWEWRGVQDDKA